MFANCTHIIVSLLKAWKVTVEGIESTMPPFNAPSRKSIPPILKTFLPNSASKVVNWIIVDILKYL